MEGSGQLKLVAGGGEGQLAGDATDAGFAVVLEIWHSALEDLAREVPSGQLRVLQIIGGTGRVSLGAPGRRAGRIHGGRQQDV
jgi:hypothetical protein